MTREDQLREVREAIQAGREALSAIEEAESNMGSARGLGVWDMFGGGMLSGFLKHSKMDEAQRCVEKAQLALQRFSRELQDINMNINYKVNFDNTTKVIDIVFDNFFVDAMIQSRIKEAQAGLQQSKIEVQNALDRLYAMERKI